MAIEIHGDWTVLTEIHFGYRIYMKLTNSFRLSLLQKFQGEDYAGHGNSWIYLPFEVAEKNHRRFPINCDLLKSVAGFTLHRISMG